MLSLKINGEDHAVDVPPDMPLLWVLRDVVGLTGTKFGCDIAQCGVCTVHLDGQPIRSCNLPVVAVGGRNITTIEAIGNMPSCIPRSRPDSLLWLALAREAKTPRIRAPRVDERSEKFPILERRLASLTSHKSIGTIPLAEKGRLKFVYLM